MQRIAMVFAALVGFSESSFAAKNLTFEVIQGTAFVETSTGYVQVHTQAEVHSGQGIIMREGATGIVSSTESGCFFSLRTGGSYRVPEVDNCAQGMAAILTAGPTITPATAYPAPTSPPAFVPLAVSVGFLTTVAAAAFYTVTENDPVSGP
jgi:hypothetical protein